MESLHFRRLKSTFLIPVNFLSVERHDGSLDDVDAFAQLVFLDDEGRGQADDVTVGGLGQQSVVAEAQAHLPGVVVWRGKV